VYLNIHDTVSNSTFSASEAINIPGFVGGETAFVGITGSEGGVYSHQTVSNFVYAPLPALSAQLTGPSTLVLSWPSVIGGYILQSKASLADTNPADWVNVSAPVSVVGGQIQVTVTPITGMKYYRLILPGNME